MKNSSFKYLNKRVLLHVLFWIFYVLFFGSIYGKYGNNYQWYLLESLCMLPFVMTATYTTIYLILPFYLKKRKLVLTVFLVVVLIFFITLGERIFLRRLNSLPVTRDSVFGVTFLYLMLETNFMLAIAFAIKIVKKWFVQQNEKHEMEKQNLKSELNLLKAQLHPHFLFNTMNNLYALSFCFKHGSSNDPEHPFITISINVLQNKMIFFSKNSKPAATRVKNTEGIGLNNVKKRLDLIYGSKYRLEIEDKQDTFTVSLSIQK